MNKVCGSLFGIFLAFLLGSCASVPENELNLWRNSPDDTFEISCKRNGIHIKNKLPANSKNVVFHIEEIDLKDSTYVDSTLVEMIIDSNLQENIYPFTRKKRYYQVYLTYTDINNRSKSTEKMKIISEGGKGECRISAPTEYASYDSKTWRLLFTDFIFEKPNKSINGSVRGNVYLSSQSKPYVYNNFEIVENYLDLRPVISKIRNKSFSLELRYSFDYSNQQFYKDFFKHKDLYFKDTNKQIVPFETGLSSIELFTDSGRGIESRVKYVNGSIKINDKVYKTQIRGRGNSSWGQMPKHTFNLKLEEKHKILGLKESKKWVLISNYADKTLLRNQYISYLGKNIFNKLPWTPDYKQVDLFLNGVYQGTYLFGERISVEKSRINFGEEGFLVEMNRREDDIANFRTTHDVSISLKDPEEAVHKKRVRDIIQKAENALFSKDFTNPETGYAAYFDVDSFIDWYLINEFSKNVDSAWFSSIYIIYNSNDKKLYMGPLWDYDLGFGNVNYNDCDKATGYYIKAKGIWYAQLFKDPAFVAKVKNRWSEKKEDLLKSITETLPNMYSEIKESTYYNFEKWPIFGKQTWRDPAGFERRLTYDSELNYLTNWCKQRYNWMNKQFGE